jgi:phosphoribosylglycinamide formyltransferase-1
VARSAVVLVSGRGSNLRAIVEARTGLEIRKVISNRPGAAGLDWSREQGLATGVVDHKAFPSREAFDAQLAAEIDATGAELVLLAGFMRVLTPGFIGHFANRIVNIHPSLLPAFPGLHTHARAIEAGVKVHGCTVHVVTPDLDAGPIIAQAVVPVMPDDTEDALAARVLAQEHRLYPQVVRWFLEDRIEFRAGGVVHVRDAGVASDSLLAPRNRP